MEIDVKQFKQNALEHNLCSEFTEIWDNCKSKKQLMDMMLGSKGVDFTCDSIAKGWGITPSYLSEKFDGFSNGRYVRDMDGYTSKFYCKYEGGICADTTILMLVDCDVIIEVPQTEICEVYCTGKNKIKVSGSGSVVFVCYGKHTDTEIKSTCKNMKRIDKKDRDRYE